MMRFGTDGIRGRAGVFPVDTHGATKMGQAAARLAAGQPVVVAWDRRPSSDGLAQAVVAGAQRAGAHVREAGVLPTAGLSEVLARGLGGAGVMVTASHNPAADNGFKLLGAGGAKLSDADAAKVEGWLIEELPCDVVPGPDWPSMVMPIAVSWSMSRDERFMAMCWPGGCRDNLAGLDWR